MKNQVYTIYTYEDNKNKAHMVGGKILPDKTYFLHTFKEFRHFLEDDCITKYQLPNLWHLI